VRAHAACAGAPSARARADGSRRAFYKDFVKVVEAADVIIEVLDARDPLSCRCLDVERFVRRAGAAKKVVLLLNKIGAPPPGIARVGLGLSLYPRPALAEPAAGARPRRSRGGGRRGSNAGPRRGCTKSGHAWCLPGDRRAARLRRVPRRP